LTLYPTFHVSHLLFYLGLRGIEWAILGYEGPRKLCIS
jgi:hypothetical protein